MASTKISVTEARQTVGRLIQRAERGDLIEITRRGERIAVLLSASAYGSMRLERSTFTDAVGKVRRRMGIDALGVGDADFEDLRGRDAGRLEERQRHRGLRR